MPTKTSHAIGRTDSPLIEDTIGHHFETIARRFPQREVLVSRHQGQRFTYAQLDRQADCLASALLRAGLAPGDRAGIWAHNCAEWLLMQIATAKAGIVLVNINPAYRVTELEYALNKVGCRMLVTMTHYKTSDYLGMLRELAPEWLHARPGQLQSATLPALRSMREINCESAVLAINMPAENSRPADTPAHQPPWCVANTLHAETCATVSTTSANSRPIATVDHRSVRSRNLAGISFMRTELGR